MLRTDLDLDLGPLEPGGNIFTDLRLAHNVPLLILCGVTQ